MRNVRLNIVDIENLNNIVDLLIHSGISTAAENEMRRDLNERENRNFDLAVRKAKNSLSHYKVDGCGANFELRPITVRIINDRSYIYDAENDERIASCSHCDTKMFIDEIRSISNDWKRYIDSMIILNGVDSFKLDDHYKFIPMKRNLTIGKAIKALKLDSGVITVIE